MHFTIYSSKLHARSIDVAIGRGVVDPFLRAAACIALRNLKLDPHRKIAHGDIEGVVSVIIGNVLSNYACIIGICLDDNMSHSGLCTSPGTIRIVITEHHSRDRPETIESKHRIEHHHCKNF